MDFFLKDDVINKIGSRRGKKNIIGYNYKKEIRKIT